jgi:hypothetical protein
MWQISKSELIEALDEIEWIISEKEKGRYRKEKPRSVIDFIEDEIFLWLWDFVYKSIKKDLQEMFSGKYQEAVFLEWIWSWKSMKVGIILLYMVYELTCMEDCFEYFGMPKEKPFIIINMWLSGKQAKWVVFEWIKSMFTKSPYFSGTKSMVMETLIRIKAPRDERKTMIELVSGNSEAASALWLNVYGAVIDESSFHFENDKNDIDKAEEMYDALLKRQRSRFWHKWFMALTSSPKYDWDFTVRMHREWQNRDNCYTVTRPTRKAKDRAKFGESVFVFDYRELCIVDVSLPYKEFWVIRLTKEQCRNFFFWDKRDDVLWIIPEEYYDDFERNPELASRDLWCLAWMALESFIKSQWKIDEAMNKWVKNRFDPLTRRFDFSNPPKEPVFVHIDIWLNRSEEWDCAWIGCCRCVGISKVEWKENMPMVIADFVAQIKAEWSGEIQLSDLRRIVFDMIEAWRYIEKVTLDNFQSVDTVQILNAHGVVTEVLSVDTNMWPYNSVKDWLYMGSLSIPKYDILEKELKALQITKSKKVDHPPKWSKYTSDWLAWEYYTCINNSNWYEKENNKRVKIKRR